MYFLALISIAASAAAVCFAVAATFFWAKLQVVKTELESAWPDDPLKVKASQPLIWYSNLSLFCMLGLIVSGIIGSVTMLSMLGSGVA